MTKSVNTRSFARPPFYPGSAALVPFKKEGREKFEGKHLNATYVILDLKKMLLSPSSLLNDKVMN